MLRALLCVSLLFGCKKADEAKPAPGPAVAAKPNEGPRKVPVEVNKEGYKPDKIAGKPGEKLTLVFTRTEESDCIAQVKVPKGGPAVDLPMNKAVEIAVTVPQTGEVLFTCGMDMFTGSVVADPST